RIPGYILFGEDTHITNGFADLIAAIGITEEAPETFWADIHGDTFRIDSRSRPLDDVLANVSRKDLDLRTTGDVSEVLEQGDGQRISLFSGRTARNPDTNRSIGRAILHETWERDLFQRFKRFGIAEETSHVDQDIQKQVFHFIWVFSQDADILIQIFDLTQEHSPRDPPSNDPLLVIRKIDMFRIS